MSKVRRGRLYKKEGGIRGKCPLSKQTGVKLSYEHEIDGKKLYISKIAYAAIKNKNKKKEASS